MYIKNIFIGFLLIFLDLTLYANQFSIEILSDFIGYVFIVMGLDELAKESPCFQKIRPYAVVMGVYSAVIFALNFLGLGNMFFPLDWLLGIVALIVSFYISYVIIQGVEDMERHYQYDLNSVKLKSIWLGMVVTQGACYVLALIPILAVVSIIASLVLGIVFLVQFSESKNRYEAMKR